MVALPVALKPTSIASLSHVYMNSKRQLALDVMRDVATQWDVASLPSKMRFQSALFPEGLVYDSENHRFGTTTISPLYRHVPNKKDLPVTEKPFLVAGAGLEPATLWL